MKQGHELRNLDDEFPEIRGFSDFMLNGVLLGSDVSGKASSIYIPIQDRGYLGTEVDFNDVNRFKNLKFSSEVPVGLFSYLGNFTKPLTKNILDLEDLRSAFFLDSPYCVEFNHNILMPDFLADPILDPLIKEMCYDSTMELYNRPKLVTSDEYFELLQ